MKLAKPAIAAAVTTAVCASGFAFAQARSPVGVAPPALSGAVTTGSVVHNWNARGDRTRVTQLEVTGITPANATVTVLCHGGGCPFRTRAFTPHDGTANLIGAFRGHALHRGANVAVIVVAPGTTGRYVSFDIVRDATPTLKAGCSAPGSTSPIGCPGVAGPAGPAGDAGPGGPAGAQGPGGVAGAVGPSDAYTAAGDSGILNDRDPVTMETLTNLPAGNWVFFMSGNATCGCNDRLDIACRLDVNGTVIKRSLVRVGLGAGGAAWADYSAMAWTNQASPFTVHVKCDQEELPATVDHPSLDGSLVALKVGALH